MSATAVRWIREWTEQGQVTYRIGRRGDDLVADWPGYGALHTSRLGDRAEFFAADGADPVDAQKFRHGLVDALVGHARGGVTLHGASFARGDRAVICVGESGAGKSSIVAEACRRPGIALVGDDTAALTLDGANVLVSPTEDVSWLIGEALRRAGREADASLKIAVPTERRADACARTVAIVQLTFADEAPAPALRLLGGADAFTSLSRSLFRFVLDEPQVQLDDFDRIERLVRSVRVYELRRPRSMAMMPYAVDSVVALLDPEVAEEVG